MEKLTDVVVSQILGSLDPTPVNPTREQKYLAYLICKNMSDLCETGRAIVNKIQLQGHPVNDLPDRDTIRFCQNILTGFYSEKMFIPDNECGNRPNWPAVSAFPKDKSDAAYRIYRAIKRNIVEKPDGKLIQAAIKKQDKSYFVQNFNKIFADIPFKDGMDRFRNFVATNHVPPEDQKYIWDFFDALLDIFIYEADNLKDLQQM